MVIDPYLMLVFLIPAAIIILIYIVLRVNLRKASQRPFRRRPTMLKYNFNREIVFWPREEDMPHLRRFLRPGMRSDPQLGPLIMIINSRFEFWLLLALNLCICLVCVDALCGGTIIKTSLTYRYWELPKYELFAMGIFVFMFFWGLFNLYRVSHKILFYEHGIMLAPKRSKRYEYNDILEIDILEQRKLLNKSVKCYISFKNNRELFFHSAQYAKLKKKITFWKHNLMWTG